MRIFKIDKFLNKVFDEAEEYFKGRTTREQIKEVYYFYWKYIIEDVRSFSFPYIKIPKFGMLIPSIKKVTKLRDKFEKSDIKDADEYVSYLDKVIKRLKFEKTKRKRND